MSTGFVFPGQGSQAVGMGRALAEAFGAARLVFEEIDDALGQRLTRLMFEGPEADLTLTENAQPALMAVSLAVLAVLESEGGFRLSDKAAFVAGHSLGEYTALAAAGRFPVSHSPSVPGGGVSGGTWSKKPPFSSCVTNRTVCAHTAGLDSKIRSTSTIATAPMDTGNAGCSDSRNPGSTQETAGSRLFLTSEAKSAG